MPSWYDSIFRGEGPGTDRITGTPPVDYSRVDAATWRAVRGAADGDLYDRRADPEYAAVRRE